MDTCSTELIVLIFEYACSDDFGKTARRLGLVSKYFRSIAEPTELRTIAVSGFKQLQHTIERLQRMRGPAVLDGPDFNVRHLFISELTMEHALASDTNFLNGNFSCENINFWQTDEGKRAEAFYDANTDGFWLLARYLVRLASPNLRTLCLLTSGNWLGSCATFSKNRVASKALGALSGASFPNLRSLAVNNNATVELSFFGDDNSPFQCPTIPSLLKVHIVSPNFMDRTPCKSTPPQHVHPLLVNIHSRCCELMHLVLYDDHFRNDEEVLKVVFGEDWRAVLGDGTLPGKLKSVVLQQGAKPIPGLKAEFVNYRRRSQIFVNAVRRLHIDGLETRLPSQLVPEAGKTEYELLLAEWKEQRQTFLWY